MTCTYCRTENPEDCVYCPSCGKPTGSAQNVAAGTVAPPPLSQSPLAAPLREADGERQLPNQSDLDMPGPQNAQLVQANLCRLRKNWTEATELCIEVLREEPADSAAHSLLGDIYRDQNRLDEAERWYRMALDLSTNPFDQANLQKIERQLAVRNAGSGSTASGADPPAPFNPVTGSLAGGTGALMGIAPQKWLKGITVSALTFLSLFVIYLISLPTRKVTPVPRAVSSEALVSDARTGSDGMPPAVLSGPTTLPSGELSAPNPSIGRVAGTGLAPDLGTGTAPAMQSQPAANGASGVGPAPVNNVSPMSSPGGPASGQLGAMAPAQSHVGEHNSALSGSVELSRVETDNGAATIQMVALSASTPRDVLVRNLYRAARTVFSNDTSLQRVTVIVHSESLDGAPQLSADVDRASVMAADPNSDDLAVLTGRLRIH